MKKKFFFSCLLFSSLLSIAQQAKLTGVVKDSTTRTPLELATVTILAQDSSVVAYQLSDRNGHFSFDKLPVNKKLGVNISYTGYTAFSRVVVLKPAARDTLAVFLSLKYNDANAIVVSTTVPIRMNGDTLEINPAAFKLKQNAVVEEVLNQVPGIVIWSDGSITVNGKKVESLLVNGKPFMGSGDPRVATQNLPRTAIDKIQLYQEYDRTNIGQEKKLTDSLLTMNIKLKENAQKGYFGKAGAGYGTDDRFESDLSFQQYDKKNSWGLGGGYNNINKNIGSLQEMFQNTTFRNYNPNLYNVGRFGSSGISKNYSLGGIYTHNFIESANSRQNNRVSVNYTKSGADTYINSLTLQNRTAINNPQFIRDQAEQNITQDRDNISVTYQKTNSYNDNFNLNGSAGSSNNNTHSITTTEVRDSLNRLQSTNALTSSQSGQSDNELMNLSFARNDFDEPVRSFNLQFNGNRSNSRSASDSKSIFQSFTDQAKNTTIDRHYDVNNESLTLGGTLDYTGFKRMLLGRYNLFGINLNFSQRVNYSRTTLDNKVRDYDSTIKQYISNAYLTNYNKRELFEYTPTLSFSKSFFKFSDIYYKSLNITARLLQEMKNDKNESSVEKRSMERSFRFSRYEGNMGYQYQKREKYFYYLSANYMKTFDYPSVDQLYTIVDNINAYNIRMGNPLLRNMTNHMINLNASFNTQNQKAVYTVNCNINGNYFLSINPVTDSIINDFSGKRLSYMINADKSSNKGLSYNFNISRKFKKNNLQLMFNGQYSTREMPNYIDGVYNTSETGSLNNQVNLQFTLSSLLVLNVGEGLQSSRSRQTATGLKGFNNSSTTSKVGAVLNYPAHFTFSTTADYVSNSNLAKPSVLWNAFTTWRFMKEQAELKFTAMDLLKQYQNIYNSVNPYGTITSISNGLQQYFLLTLSYYPRKFGKTEIRRQQEQR